ncbi:MAG TPA: cyclic nucleotide-binding domain-containing protein [Burkholderiaceae bacterium]|jgi:CRP-like cAMP-binding protein
MSVHCEPATCQLLLRLNLFRGLDETELLLLLEEAELVNFADGDYPIVEGEQGQFMFVILSGKVRIAKRSFGIQKQIGELGPGECFGEMSLIECRSRSASVKALGSCKLLRIDGDKMARIPAIAAILYRNIATLLSQRLRHANDILTLG